MRKISFILVKNEVPTMRRVQIDNEEECIKGGCNDIAKKWHLVSKRCLKRAGFGCIGTSNECVSAGVYGCR